MMILRGGHDFFLLGFRGGLSKISSYYVEEGIRGGGIEKSMKSSITVTHVSRIGYRLTKRKACGIPSTSGVATSFSWRLCMF